MIFIKYLIITSWQQHLWLANYKRLGTELNCTDLHRITRVGLKRDTKSPFLYHFSTLSYSRCPPPTSNLLFSTLILGRLAIRCVKSIPCSYMNFRHLVSQGNRNLSTEPFWDPCRIRLRSPVCSSLVGSPFWYLLAWFCSILLPL